MILAFPVLLYLLDRAIVNFGTLCQIAGTKLLSASLECIKVCDFSFMVVALFLVVEIVRGRMEKRCLWIVSRESGSEGKTRLG